MICRCGYQNEPDDFYCAQCGRKLSRRNKGAKGWIIAIVVVLFLAAGALTAWFFVPWNEIGEKPQEETQSEEEPRDPQAVRPEDVREPEEEEIPQEGWDSSRTCYYEEGKAVTGLREINGEYYYFDEESCQKQTGWVKIGENWHFFTEGGPAPGAGWYSDDKGWFYLEEDGKHHRESPFPDEKNKREYILDDGYLVRIECAELVCIESTEMVEGSEMPVLMIQGTLVNCKTLTFHCKEISSITPMDAAIWEIWIHQEDQWVKIKESPVQNEDGGYVLTFAEPQTFDKISFFTSQNYRIQGKLTNVVLSY